MSKQSLRRIEKHAKSLGSDLSAVCAGAGVSRTTIARIRAGHTTGHEPIFRLQTALHRIARQRIAAATRVLQA